MKTIMRKEFLAKRDEISQEHVSVAAAVVKDSLFHLSDFTDAKMVMFYVSFGNEIGTHVMIRETLAVGKRVCVPVMQGRDFVAGEITSFDDLDSKDSLGIPMPSVVKEVAKQDIDLVVTPVIAFDSQNHRIGYGNGCYDRFLRDYPGKKIGLAYRLQKVERIATDENDVALDLVITS